ncbi:hypothetical protein Tco_0369265 [Tanacetum coccineum]
MVGGNTNGGGWYKREVVMNMVEKRCGGEYVIANTPLSNFSERMMSAPGAKCSSSSISSVSRIVGRDPPQDPPRQPPLGPPQGSDSVNKPLETDDYVRSAAGSELLLSRNTSSHYQQKNSGKQELLET